MLPFVALTIVLQSIDNGARAVTNSRRFNADYVLWEAARHHAAGIEKVFAKVINERYWWNKILVEHRSFELLPWLNSNGICKI